MGNETWRRTHEWGALTRAEIAQARDAGALVVLPVGAVEQHANHLPVDTDSLSARRVAQLAAERCRSPHVLLLPTAAFGFSPHHGAWAGTVSLSLATFAGMIADIAASLQRTGFARLLIVNGHGGNQGPLIASCTEITSRGFGAGFVNYFQPGMPAWLPTLPGALRRVGHACAYETAMQLALRPADETALIEARASGLPPRLLPSYMADGAADPTRDAGGYWAPIFGLGDAGYSGDPGAATRAAGEVLLEATVAGLAAFFPAFAQAPFLTGGVG